MKKIISLCLIAFIACSCKNDDWSFPDFDYTTSYFPYQYPVRTLVLGDYNYDNSDDKEGRFLISATMGGVYENKDDITIQFVIDESLTENLYDGTTKIDPMPKEYYTLSSENKITIPKGSFSGGVEVQLSDAFFNDLSAVNTHYVIPLRMTEASTDSILEGSPVSSNPDPRIASDWIKTPKNFTLFAVKFVNEFHGKYLLRGKSVFTDSNYDISETVFYRQKEVEQDEVVSLITSARRKVRYDSSVRRTSGSPGNFQIEITYDDDGIFTIKNTESSDFEVKGNGKFVQNGDEWGGKKRNVIYMGYEITEGAGLKHEVTDTLVYRDKAVSFLEFSPNIIR